MVSFPRRPIASLLALLVAGAVAVPRAGAKDPAPEAVTTLIREMEAAANRRDLDAATAPYSETFSRTDGLTTTALASGLEAFWERFPRLSYDIELLSWTKTDEGIEYETVTRISGSGKRGLQTTELEAMLRSRQRLEDGRIVSQEVIEEETQVTLGKEPPRVRVIAPDVVAAGEEFGFDVIALDPLGDEVLLGAASEEPVDGANYTRVRPLELDVLPAGGLYQVGTAPKSPRDRWLSAVVARPGGVIFIGRRLRVVASVD